MQTRPAGSSCSAGGPWGSNTHAPPSEPGRKIPWPGSGRSKKPGKKRVHLFGGVCNRPTSPGAHAAEPREPVHVARAGAAAKGCPHPGPFGFGQPGVQQDPGGRPVGVRSCGSQSTPDPDRAADSYKTNPTTHTHHHWPPQGFLAHLCAADLHQTKPTDTSGVPPCNRRHTPQHGTTRWPARRPPRLRRSRRPSG